MNQGVALKLDLELLEIDWELAVLQTHRVSMESHLAEAADAAVDAEYARALVEWKDEKMASTLASTQRAYLRDITFPRTFRGAFIVLLFAVFEDSVKVLAKRAARQHKGRIRLDDFKGSLLDQATLFFRDHLGLGSFSEATYNSLRILAEVRNIFAHQGGRLRPKTDPRRNDEQIDRFRSLASRGLGPDVMMDEYLVPSSSYVHASLNLVMSAVHELGRQVAPGYRWPTAGR